MGWSGSGVYRKFGWRGVVGKNESCAFALKIKRGPGFAGAFFVERGLIVALRYQFSFRANWNWRASKAALGWPAAQTGPAVGSQSWFTAATLVRLNRLKASAMRSRRKRSPKLMPFETRRSNWKNPGDVNLSRPSVPKQPKGGATPVTEKGCLALVRQTVGRPKLAP